MGASILRNTEKHLSIIRYVMDKVRFFFIENDFRVVMI
jgi:hypothetical protein